MSENNDKAVTGGTIWSPSTYADANAAYQAAFSATNEQHQKDWAAKRFRQGIYISLVGLTMLMFISIFRINLALSADASTYYFIPNSNHPILVIVSLIGSVTFGYGAGTLVLGIRKKKLLFFPILFALVVGLAAGIPATASKMAEDNFNSWLESTYSLSSFDDGTPKLEDLADKKVAMLNTDGEKVSVTFSTKDNKVSVLDIAPAKKEAK